MNAYTENVISVRFLKFNIADSLGIGADADCMFVVVNKLIAGNAHFGKRIKERIDRTVSPAHHILRFAVHGNYAGKNRRVVVILFFVLLINKMALDDFVFPLQVNKFFLEEFHDLQFVQFITVRIRRSFDDVAEFRLHGLGHAIALRLFQHKGCAAFTGLAVDPDDGFVLPVDIRRIDGKIGNFPILRTGLFHVIKAFFDGILMGTGKGSERQLARIRLPGRD